MIFCHRYKKSEDTSNGLRWKLRPWMRKPSMPLYAPGNHWRGCPEDSGFNQDRLSGSRVAQNCGAERHFDSRVFWRWLGNYFGCCTEQTSRTGKACSTHTECFRMIGIFQKHPGNQLPQSTLPTPNSPIHNSAFRISPLRNPQSQACLSQSVWIRSPPGITHRLDLLNCG